jgi:hypothetical protein
MTPSRKQWPLTPALRYAALAMILAVGALMSVGILSILLWVGAAVAVVLGAVKLRANWSRTRETRP